MSRSTRVPPLKEKTNSETTGKRGQDSWSRSEKTVTYDTSIRDGDHLVGGHTFRPQEYK